MSSIRLKLAAMSRRARLLVGCLAIAIIVVGGVALVRALTPEPSDPSWYGFISPKHAMVSLDGYGIDAGHANTVAVSIAAADMPADRGVPQDIAQQLLLLRLLALTAAIDQNVAVPTREQAVAARRELRMRVGETVWREMIETGGLSDEEVLRQIGINELLRRLMRNEDMVPTRPNRQALQDAYEEMVSVAQAHKQRQVTVLGFSGDDAEQRAERAAARLDRGASATDAARDLEPSLNEPLGVIELAEGVYAPADRSVVMKATRGDVLVVDGASEGVHYAIRIEGATRGQNVPAYDEVRGELCANLLAAAEQEALAEYEARLSKRYMRKLWWNPDPEKALGPTRPLAVSIDVLPLWFAPECG